MNYIAVLTIGERIPIDSDEVEKVIAAKLTNSVYFARRGMIDGRLVGTIVPDYHRKKGMYYGYDISKEISFSDERALPDAFSEHREKINALLTARTGTNQAYLPRHEVNVNETKHLPNGQQA